MAWPTPCAGRQEGLGLRAIAILPPVSDGSAAGSRSHRPPRAALRQAQDRLSRQPAARAPIATASAPLRPSHRYEPSKSAVDQDIVEGRRVGHGVEKPLPYATAGPAAEARMDCCRFAEHLRQITPMSCTARHPQDRIDEQPVVNAAPARRPDPSGKMAVDPPPLLVRQRSSAQDSFPSETKQQGCVPPA